MQPQLDADEIDIVILVEEDGAAADVTVEVTQEALDVDPLVQLVDAGNAEIEHVIAPVDLLVVIFRRAAIAGQDDVAVQLVVNLCAEVRCDGARRFERADIDDAAVLKMSFDISGYTPQFVSALQDMQKQMSEGKVDQQAQGLAMLGLMQQLTFNGMQIRIEDASLTGKLLDFFGKQQGADGNAMAQQLKGMMPFMLGQLGNPEFAANVSSAVGTYLDNPKSLTITAAPASPVPAAQIMAAGMSAPQTIPDVLGVVVTAND